MCWGLDCGSVVSANTRRSFNRSDVWNVRSYCLKKSAVRDCVDESFSRPSDSGLEVKCSDSVRLLSGPSLCSGLVQIRDRSLNRPWSSVCEKDLGRRGAEVLCRELGCGTPLLQGELSPLGQMFQCEGHESALMDCARNQTRTCSGPALNLTCSELRLVGGASRCEGTVELLNNGEWRRVVTSECWDLEAAAVVCRNTDCGAAVSAEKRSGFNHSAVLDIDPECVKKKSSVRNCLVGDYNRGHRRYTQGLVVMCSESLDVPEVSVSGGVWSPWAEGGLWLMTGADFWVKCCVELKYPDGFFLLLSPTLNLTQPAVDHCANFLFTNAGSAHKGNYTCVYLLQTSNYRFSTSSSLLLYPQGESPKTVNLTLGLILLCVLLVSTATTVAVFCWRRSRKGKDIL